MNSLPWFSTSRSYKLTATCPLLVALVCTGATSAVAQTAHFGVAQTTLGSGFGEPWGVAVDKNGDVFVSDFQNNAVEEILTVNGVVPASPTIIQLGSGYSSPAGLAFDANGNLYVADYGNGAVKEVMAVNGTIPASPAIVTLATGLTTCRGITVDNLGNVYVSEFFNPVIEIVAVNGSIPPSPTIRTLSTSFFGPSGLAVDGSGNLYVADVGNHAVKEILALNGVIPSSPTIITLSTGLTGPTGVALDESGDLYVTDSGSESLYEVLAVNGTIPASPAVTKVDSGLLNAMNVALDGSGNLYIADTYNARVLEISPSGANFYSAHVGSTASAISMTFVFDTAGTLGSTAVLAQGATGLDFADAGTGSCTANTAYTSGQTCTVNVTFSPRFAGTRYGAVVLKDTSGTVFATGYLQGTGVAPQITFLPSSETTVLSGVGLNAPTAIALDAGGNLYISNANNQRLVKAAPAAGSYALTTIATGLTGAYGVAIDGAGNVYIGDTGNQRVLKESPTATGYTQTTVDSGFGYPMGVAVDGVGNVYVSDQSNSRILEETPTSCGYTRSVVVTGLSYPSGVAVDASGNLYIADTNNLRVLKETLTPNGYVQSTLPVSGQVSAQSIAVDALGNVYFEDALTDNVFKETLTPSGYVESTIVSDLHVPSGPYGVAVDGSGNVYVAYTEENSVVKADFADAPSLTFANTVVGSTSADSPQTVTLENIGNADLTLPIPASGSNPSIADGFSLDSNAPSACPVVGSGASTAGTVPTGTSCELPISFTPTANGNISGSLVLTDNNLNAIAPVYATQGIVLSGTATAPVAPAITWPTPAPIIYGTPLGTAQLDATANIAGTFVYSPTLGSVLTAGPHTLTVTFTPTDTTDYTTATASTILTVNKGAPTLTWPTPKPITYGTALSSTQLNATANVPGTFIYTPPAGTVPTVGTDALTVVFTPTDTTDYATSSASVNLTVNPLPGFTLSASPSSLSVTQGRSASTTVSVADVGGFSGKVSLSVSNLPSGVTCSFSKNPATGTSILTLSAGNKDSTGTSTITITGTSGKLTQETTINLTVNPRK